MQMKYVWSCIVYMTMTCPAWAQSGYIGLFAGPAAYSGDLCAGIFPQKITKGAYGGSFSFELNERYTLRAGYTHLFLSGADRYNSKPTLSLRNLSFQTEVNEYSIMGEYYLKPLKKEGYSPYLFAGFALFTFDPFSYDAKGQKIYLQPLSTEGQGLPQYPNRRPYKLMQPAIPFGGGVRFIVSKNIRVGIETGLRKLFTEYLDDVSTTYVRSDYLLQEKGPLAVEMAYRGDEIEGGSPYYPGEGEKRGNPRGKDFYYYAGLHLMYAMLKGKPRMGCPVNVY